MLGIMSSPGWRTVVFDLDGTLANTIPLIIASYDHAMSEVLGVRADPEQARGWIGETLKDTFSTNFPEHADALMESYVDFNLASLSRLLERYPGIDDLLSDLRSDQVRLGVATSKRRKSAELTLSAAGLTSLIPLTVAAEDTLQHKPAPEPLLLAVERLGGRPEEAIYVGDAVVDIAAAHAAGMRSVGVCWGAGRREALVAAGPDFVVETVDELHSILAGDAKRDCLMC